MEAPPSPKNLNALCSLLLTEQDALLALGIVPVATREWYGERPGAIFMGAHN